MNHYRFEDMKIGMTHQFTVQIDEARQQLFTQLTEDINPLHLNDDFAKDRGFQGQVVYGMLASSYYSTLAGVFLPGENCLLNECKITYLHPVYIGDTLTVEGTVSDIRESTGRIRISGKMINQDGTIVNTAVISVSFTEKKA